MLNKPICDNCKIPMVFEVGKTPEVEMRGVAITVRYVQFWRCHNGSCKWHGAISQYLQNVHTFDAIPEGVSNECS